MNPWRRTACLAATMMVFANAGGAETPPAPSVPHAARSLLLDGARADGRLVVVGARGHIIISDDEAATWRLAETPVRSMLTAVHMHDATLGWAVGHDAVILRTDDGGETWRLVHQAPEEGLPLLDILFSDERNGLAIGAYGYLLFTDDGGETWSRGEVSEDDHHMNAVASADGTLYIAAEAGSAFLSEDGANRWRTLEPPYHGSWFGVAAIGPETVILVGLRGRMFRSDDRGSNWTRVPTDTTASLTSVQRTGPREILVTGLEGVLLESRDGGRSVSLRRMPDRAGISAALPLANGQLLLIGDFGVRRVPADG